MASLTLGTDTLILAFDTADKVLGLVNDIVVPIASITSIAVTDDPFAAAKGIRAPGLAIPRLVRVGTWRSRGRKLLVAARNNERAIVLGLHGEAYSGLVVGTDTAPELAVELLAVAPNIEHLESDVTFASGDVVLAGTYTQPAGPTVAQVLLLPGSGDINRDADHRRFPLSASRHLAHALAARGIASVRYDKRGVGRSSGSYLHTGFAENHADASAALQWLRSSTPTAGLPTFLVGHSEGAMIAQLLAADDDRLAGVILLASPGTTGAEAMEWQTHQVARALPPVAGAIIKLLRIDLAKQQRKSVAKLRSTDTDTVRIQGRTINARWQRDLLDFDPATLLRRITAPVLAITGGKDLQVNPDDLKIIAESVSGPVETQRPADLTHLLRSDPKPASFASYKKLLKQDTDKQVVDTVGDWILARSTTRV
ncbi:alpha/beta hydrolase [Arthrobacter crusticola]|uniref:alpha/beta hydrolase n=1 Tax=Arthrobacter crusticola TaxID=2547960 RepID=UPI001404FF74|nr:alpha/beta fold hydrolase [Arthrobacter crusticola]